RRMWTVRRHFRCDSTVRCQTSGSSQPRGVSLGRSISGQHRWRAPRIAALRIGASNLDALCPVRRPPALWTPLGALARPATYLHQDGARYWYSTQPTVTKLAEDRAEQLKRDPDAVVHEVERRLKADLRAKGDFSGVHALPTSSQDVADDLGARLVVLGLHQ